MGISVQLDEISSIDFVGPYFCGQNMECNFGQRLAEADAEILRRERIGDVQRSLDRLRTHPCYGFFMFGVMRGVIVRCGMLFTPKKDVVTQVQLILREADDFTRVFSNHHPESLFLLAIHQTLEVGGRYLAAGVPARS